MSSSFAYAIPSSVTLPLSSVHASEVLGAVMNRRPATCPFVRWHLEQKFRVMEALLEKYLQPSGRFLDMACGHGDGLLLASRCRPTCELWGLDIDPESVEHARRVVPAATLIQGDMLRPDALPEGYFDVVHEFGATFFIKDWSTLARVYLSKLKVGGVL